MISVIIPSRNEEYLENTIRNLLKRAYTKIEIVVFLDGHTTNPLPKDLRTHPQLKFIRRKNSVGMREAINLMAKKVTGKYLMKCDAHCCFDKHFDRKLLKAHQLNMVQVPRRYAIDKNKWDRHENKALYNDFQYISHPKDPVYQFKGVDWPEFGARVRGQKIVDLMTSQGSCWFMEKKFFEKIGGLDDKNYGTMGAEAQEVCLKTWLSGGRYVLNRNTWYAHKKKRVGVNKNDYGYRKPVGQWRKSRAYTIDCWTNNKWKGQIKDLKWLINKFKPVPGWHTKFETVKIQRHILDKYDLNYGTDEYPRVIPNLNREGLVKLWKELGYKTGCEVGVAKGNFTRLMFTYIPYLKMYLVDPYRDYKGGKRYGKIHASSKRKAEERTKGYNVAWLEEFSETAFNKIEDGSLDFVYIDGNHKYDWVMLDIILWQRKVRPGGMIAGHDYCSHNRYDTRDIKRAVDHYIEAHKIAPVYLTDTKAQKHKGDKHASWLWIKE